MDYTKYNDAPKNEDLGQLSELIDALHQAEIEAQKAEEAAKAAKRKVMNLAENEIPELMARLGVQKFTTNSGLEVRVNSSVRASIPVANRPAAYQWLEDHGLEGVIKRNVTVAFGRGEEEQVRKLKAELGTVYSNVKEDQKVESSTLRATIRELLESGVDVPLDLFGVQQIQTAKVKVTK